MSVAYSQKPHETSSHFLCMLPVTVARSSSKDNATYGNVFGIMHDVMFYRHRQH